MTEPDIHVVVCDDEEDVREMVGEYLERRGYSVSTAASADTLRGALSAAPVDAVILDINMPGEDGLSALRALRVENDVPVLMLTAASDVVDRIIGLEMGADDYLGKPVDLRELEARLKAVLRRRTAPAPKAGGETVAFGPCRLDLAAARLYDAEGAEVPITAMEFSLLKVFAENPGRVLNRDQLLEQAHDRSWDPFDRSIDIRISRLRRKIEPNAAKPEVIRTVRGVGYVFSRD
jgi:two-component system phosphate regulon response regulator OmpR